MEGETICLQDLFHHVQTGVDPAGNAEGYYEACGVRPRLLERLEAKGVKLPESMFMRRRLATGGTASQRLST
jgi:pilus assembly protein CpaF